MAQGIKEPVFSLQWLRTFWGGGVAKKKRERESNTERQVLGKRKDSFIEEVCSPGEKVVLCPQTQTPFFGFCLKTK